MSAKRPKRARQQTTRAKDSALQALENDVDTELSPLRVRRRSNDSDKVRKRKRDSSSTASSVTIVCIDSEDEQNSTAKEGVRNTEEHDEELEDEDDDEPGASSRSTIFLSFVASAILTETAIDPPILISFSIFVYSKKEFKKSNKNRRATASGILKLDNSLSEYKFCRAVYKKVRKLASVVASEDNTRILFTIARSVPNPIELDDESTTFEHMMETASGMTKPAVTLAVVLDDGNETSSSDEKDAEKTTKNRKKSKVPSEKDIDPANASINLKIQLLRNKYICNAADGSDHCYVNENGKHIPLGHSHFRTWAAAMEDGTCTDEAPPNHHLFDENAPSQSSLLQRRIAAQANARAPATPVINNHFTIPDALLNFLPRTDQDRLPPLTLAPASASTPALAPAPTPVSASIPASVPASAISDTLLPPGTNCGMKISVTEFCRIHQLDDSILHKLTNEGYKTTATFRYVSLKDLETINFLSGEIAELREAVREWAVPV
ncbi:hypothetical protein GGX14DRAFT_562284 [Mycena pura]|uniref:Uncharacterized protein n=1 Tax=Mycena pura TaxID=153505 RepID=A0AAD6VNW3_9AGAR|nr:hypothetical protein GGX14DRAFT_562284 [Mycena pura]